jgi:glycosyltransferase involved in cell wall biosynthesis
LEKILFILKLPPPVHGSTLMNLNVFNSRLIREQFEAHYFSLSLSRELSEVGRIKWHKLKKTISDYFSLFHILRKVKPRMVYFAVSPVGFAFYKDYIFYSIIKMHRIPVVFHHHGKGVSLQGKKSRVYDFFYRRMFSDSYHICLSKELLSDLSPYSKTDPYIVPNGIRDEGIIIDKIQKETAACRIIYLSNFIIKKGVLDVIAACKILKDQGLNFEVALVGKAQDISENEIMDRIRDFGLAQYIRIVGPKYDEEKFKLLKKSDFFVFPTKYERESFPLVILEAMQSALPVISTREGGIPSIIDNDVQGYLINKDDIPALADKMGYLIRNPEIIERMGKHAREKYESNYTLEKFEICLTKAIGSALHIVKNKNIA